MRFLYALCAFFSWVLFLGLSGVSKSVDDKTLLLSLSIVVAGALAGGA